MTQVLTFSLGRESCGLEIDAVQEIVEDPALHFVPFAGGVLLASINLHGRVLPVVDLAMLLDQTERQRDHRLIVLTPEYRSLAFTVSAVGKILTFDLDELQPAAADEAAGAARGILDHDGHQISLLDADQIINRLEHIFAE